MSFEGLTTHTLSSWKKYILNVLKEEGAYSPYTMICDFGNYDDSYEIGRVTQILLDAGEVEFNEEWKLILSTKRRED